MIAAVVTGHERKADQLHVADGRAHLVNGHIDNLDWPFEMLANVRP